MKRWIVPLGSLVGVAGVAALALFLAGVFDGDGAVGAGADGQEAAALCAEDRPDCEDTLVGSDGSGEDGEGTGIEPDGPKPTDLSVSQPQKPFWITLRYATCRASGLHRSFASPENLLYSLFR